MILARSNVHGCSARDRARAVPPVVAGREHRGAEDLFGPAALGQGAVVRARLDQDDVHSPLGQARRDDGPGTARAEYHDVRVDVRVVPGRVRSTAHPWTVALPGGVPAAAPGIRSAAGAAPRSRARPASAGPARRRRASRARRRSGTPRASSRAPQRRDVVLDLPDRAPRVVLAGEDQHRGADGVHVGQRAGVAVLLRHLVRRAAEQAAVEGLEALHLVLVRGDVVRHRHAGQRRAPTGRGRGPARAA